ncbi:MAG: hypothetical protein FWC78_01200, partial [Defluviitaleaceae bacterium]|nr:hypothetical protein [Defluviitaleaceae bacterium]
MHKKNRLLMAVLLVMLLAGAVVAFILLPGNRGPEAGFVGAAEAVAVTPVTTFDGITDTGNIFDELYNPIGLAFLGDYLVIADSMCDRIQIINGRDNQHIGTPGRFGLSYGYSGAFIDGFLEYAMFMKPSGVFVTPSGDIIVSDTANHAIRMITGAFVITVAGNGTSGFRDGAETHAMFNSPKAAVVCQNGYIYVADTLNHVLRRIDPSGNVSLFAGAPGSSGFADGQLADARFFQPSGLYITGDGVLYIADSANHAIRRLQDGMVSTVAGRPGEAIRFSDYFEGGHMDGANAYASFNFPRDIAMLPNGYLLVADSLNHSIRMITPEYTRTILGGGAAGRFHYSAENLQLTRPEGLAINGEMLYISDTFNNTVVSVPLTDRVLAGRPTREQMLVATELTINSRFAFRGDIRIFYGNQRINMGRVQPWIVGDSIFMPIRPLLEALGATVNLCETTGDLTIIVGDTITTLAQGLDYFIMRGMMVTTMHELMRLFPYTIEWFPELSLITVYVPQDLRGGGGKFLQKLKNYYPHHLFCAFSLFPFFWEPPRVE